MDVLKYFFACINSLEGVWGFFSLLIAVAASLVGMKIFLLPTGYIKGVNVTLFFCEIVTETRYPKRLYVGIRNLTGHDILIQSPYIHLKDKHIASDWADGHTSMGRFELKFKDEENIYYRENLTLIRATKEVETFLPLAPAVSPDRLAELDRCCKWGNYLSFEVVFLDEKLKIKRCKVKLSRIQDRGKFKILPEDPANPESPARKEAIFDKEMESFVSKGISAPYGSDTTSADTLVEFDLKPGHGRMDSSDP